MLKPSDLTFQSTRPMRGATSSRSLRISASRNFNPRAPCGARPKQNRWGGKQAEFQSTRPMRGATIRVDHSTVDGKISIHAPHAGRDFPNRKTFWCKDISIHAPHAGRDLPLTGIDHQPIDFNPRAPCGARPTDMAFPDVSKIFQSTRPMRGATSKVVSVYNFYTISIHAPHAGRDKQGGLTMDIEKKFQSTRPMRGATPTAKRRPPDCQGFQSTRPMRGATLDDLQPYKTVKISIHAPHAGRDLLSISPMPATMTFQSTRPMRGATRYTDHRAVERERFQSTRPMRGATRPDS